MGNSDVTKGKLFSFLFLGYFYAYLPFAIIFAFLSLFGLVPVTFNGTPIYGFWGFVLMFFYIPITAIVFTISNWLYLSLGLWIQSKVKQVFRKRTS